jgi:hypothetical protein
MRKPGVPYSKAKLRNSSFGAGQARGSMVPPVQSDANQIHPPHQQTRYPKLGGKNSRPSMRK